MKTKLKVLTRILLVVTIIFAMSMSSLGAWKSVAIKNTGNTKKIYSATCQFTSLKTNKITVVNKTNFTMLVYIDGVYKGDLAPGRQYTFAQYGYIDRTFNVVVYSKRAAAYTWKTNELVLKTSSGSIVNSRVYK